MQELAYGPRYAGVAEILPLLGVQPAKDTLVRDAEAVQRITWIAGPIDLAAHRPVDVQIRIPLRRLRLLVESLDRHVLALLVVPSEERIEGAFDRHDESFLVLIGDSLKRPAYDAPNYSGMLLDRHCSLPTFATAQSRSVRRRLPACSAAFSGRCDGRQPRPRKPIKSAGGANTECSDARIGHPHSAGSAGSGARLRSDALAFRAFVRPEPPHVSENPPQLSPNAASDSLYSFERSTR